MDDLEVFQRLGLALAMGLLFGLERAWHQRSQSEGDRIAGVRTFAIAGLPIIAFSPLFRSREWRV
jgi:uncharacterized membrane protein YhiD involved in acid resistance